MKNQDLNAEIDSLIDKYLEEVPTVNGAILGHNSDSMGDSYSMEDLLKIQVKRDRISPGVAVHTILSSSMDGYWSTSCVKKLLIDLAKEGFVDPPEAVQLFLSSGLPEVTFALMGPEFIRSIANVKGVKPEKVIQTILSSDYDDRIKSNLLKEFTEELVERGTINPDEATRAILTADIDADRKEKCLKYLLEALSKKGYISAAEADEAMLSVTADDLCDVMENILSGSSNLRQTIAGIMEEDKKDYVKTRRVEKMLERLVAGEYLSPFDAIQAIARSDMEKSWKNLRYRELLEYLVKTKLITPDLAVDLLLKTETVCPIFNRSGTLTVKEFELPNAEHSRICIPEMDRDKMGFHLKELMIGLVRDRFFSAEAAARIIVSSVHSSFRMREFVECLAKEGIIDLSSAIQIINDSHYSNNDILIKELLTSLACGRYISMSELMTGSKAISDPEVRDELFAVLIEEGIIEEGDLK